MKKLEELSSSINGELYNIFFYEEINSLVDHLIHTHNRPTVSLLIANIHTNRKQVNIDSQEYINKYFTTIRIDNANNNPLTWKVPHIVKLGKFPVKCLDNYSVIHFPEDAYFIFSDQRYNNSIFCNVEYPSYPIYYVDVQ